MNESKCNCMGVRECGIYSGIVGEGIKVNDLVFEN